MRIRNKVLTVILLLWGTLVVVTYLGSQFIIKKSYLDLEEKSVSNNLMRVQQALDQMRASVKNTLGSWAIWDDTWNFMADRNDKYIKSNLPVSSFGSSDIDMVLYFDPSGKPFYTIASNPTHTAAIPLPDGLDAYLAPDSKIVHQPEIDSGMDGFISIPSGLLMVAAHSIVSSKGTGPVRGTLMMAKYFDESSLDQLEKIVQLQVKIFSLDKIKKDGQLQAVQDALIKSQDGYWIVRDSTEMLTAYSFLNGINQLPVAIIKVKVPRLIYQLGEKTVNYYNLMAALTSALLILLLWRSLNSLVIRRIEKLNSTLRSAHAGKASLQESIRDLPDELSSVAILYYHATHDPLTGLGNRHLIYQEFQSAITLLHGDNKIIIISIDIDRFKYINDTLGHETGDKLLVELARQMMTLLKPRDLAIRSGGDEFVIMLTDMDREHVHTMVKRIFNALQKSFEIDGQQIDITCSMGVSLYPDNGRDIPTLLKHADIALFQAKSAGRDRYEYYSEDLQSVIQQESKKELELQKALDENQLCLYYQPIHDVITGTILNVEALIRWHHPEYGLLAASEVIPLAEKTGLIIPVGKWVLKTACYQMKKWHEQGYPAIPVAVNLSLLQIQNDSINDLVTEALNASGLEPQYLELELTETNYVEMTPTIINDLHLLREKGIKLTVDDFGMGYSGLGYLRSLPVSKLKIDQSFIRDIESDMDDQTIILAIIAIAHQLNLLVVAEGVETKEQFEFLKTNHVDGIQGNYLSYPLDVLAYEKLVGVRKQGNVSSKDTC